MTRSSLLRSSVGVSATPSHPEHGWVHLSTLRHFDNKVPGRHQNGPLIPCERRLAKTEILEIQEVTFRARFGI